MEAPREKDSADGDDRETNAGGGCDPAAGPSRDGRPGAPGQSPRWRPDGDSQDSPDTGSSAEADATGRTGRMGGTGGPDLDTPQAAPDGQPAAPPLPASAPPLRLTVPDEAAGERLDKALARAAADIPGLSRSRLAQLIEAGAVFSPDGGTLDEPRRKVRPGESFLLRLPEPEPALPAPEAIPLAIIHEDADLIVIDKPAGMVVHPAPGAERGTLVNALLHHCGESLAGIGGERRPGIVHRIDKDTSGLLVVAKTEAAHAALAAQFAAHSIDRRYLALLWGAPDRADPRLAGLPATSFEAEGWIRIETGIGRHPADRKRMAVRRDGRRAVTRLRALARFGSGEAAGGPARGMPSRPILCLAECRLETGRTHQIRVHASHIGHPLVGDPVYGSARRLAPDRVSPDLIAALGAFPRQALHAQALGFVHPRGGDWLAFEAPTPADMAALIAECEAGVSD